MIITADAALAEVELANYRSHFEIKKFIITLVIPKSRTGKMRLLGAHDQLKMFYDLPPSVSKPVSGHRGRETQSTLAPPKINIRSN